MKDVRIVTHKSGAPKGLAYIEYEDEVILQTDLVKVKIIIG